MTEPPCVADAAASAAVGAPDASAAPAPTRRSFLRFAGGGAALAVGASLPLDAARRNTRSEAAVPTAQAGAAGVAMPVPVAAAGAHQAGVGRPATPQPHQVLAVYDLDGGTAAAGPRVATVLADMGRRILDVVAGRSDAMVGLAAGDVTVTVGVGPRLVRAVGPSLPGAEELPSFARERMTHQQRGGDVLVQVCASDPVVASVALAAVTAGQDALAERWRQAAARGAPVPLPDGRSATRNVMGFVDGIVAPEGPLETAPEVWLESPGPVRGGTIAVVRRMEIDVASFAGRPLAEQEAVVGRRRASAVPLSGGSVLDSPQLGAVTSDGRYVVPLHAHVRRAHSSATGVPRMLRRSYSMSAGLLFVSYQRELHTFVATMNRMQAGDDLFDLTTTTAAGAFLVLPGFDRARPLGGSLFG